MSSTLLRETFKHINNTPLVEYPNGATAKDSKLTQKSDANCTPQAGTSKEDDAPNESVLQEQVDPRQNTTSMLHTQQQCENQFKVKTGAKRKRLLLEWMRKKTSGGNLTTSATSGTAKKHRGSRSSAHVTCRQSSKRGDRIERKKIQKTATLCNIRCRLYALGADSTWVDRGIGHCRVVFDIAQNKMSVEVRQAETKSIRANFIAQTALEKNGARGWMVNAHNFYALTGILQKEMFAFKFKSTELADEFAAAYSEGLKHNNQVTSQGNTKTPKKLNSAIVCNKRLAAVVSEQQGEDSSTEDATSTRVLVQGQDTPRKGNNSSTKSYTVDISRQDDGVTLPIHDTMDVNNKVSPVANTEDLVRQIEELKAAKAEADAEIDSLKVELQLGKAREKEASEEVSALQQRVIKAEDELKLNKLEQEAELEAREDEDSALEQTRLHACSTLQNVLAVMSQVKGLVGVFEQELTKSVDHLSPAELTSAQCSDEDDDFMGELAQEQNDKVENAS